MILKTLVMATMLLALVCSELQAAPVAPTLPAPQLPIATPGFNFKSTAHFDDLRQNILGLIGTGRKRVWLLTDSLTDGEIASALYLAKYRNLDVKVYLGRDQLNASGSRLPYLRGQSVPSYLRPRTGYTTPTLLFVDQRLYGITRDMNSQQRLGNAEIVQASPADVKAFVSWLKDVMESPEIAYPRAFRSGRTPKEPFQGDSEGSYNYDRRGGNRKAPEGVTRELPRVPKWKQTEELRKRGVVPPIEVPPSEPGATAPGAVIPGVPAPEAPAPEALNSNPAGAPIKPWTPGPAAVPAAPAPSPEPLTP